MKHFRDLSEQEVLALAVANEEEDSRIYLNFAAKLRANFPQSAKVFEEMAEEESHHRQWLIDMHVQRFGNRIRYLAMLQQPEHLDTSGWDALRERWLALLRRPVPPPPTAQSDEAAVDDHLTVALGALQEAFGSQWRARVRDPAGAGPSAAVVQGAIAAYRRATGRHWPPDTKALDAFDRTLGGARVVAPPKIGP